MTKLEQAARQALEALEDIFGKGKVDVGAITALREALAGDNMSPTEQAKQELVAEYKAQVNELIKESARLIASISDEGDRYLTAIDMLRNAYRLGLKDAAPVRTKDLTDDEISKLRHKIDWTAEWSYVNFARAVIAADREKNL